MNLTRRDFLVLTTLGCAGCETARTGSQPPARSNPSRTIDAGPATRYSRDGVYSQFKEQGIFIVRSSGNLTVLSSICTHRRCKLDAEADHSFSCPCHGSTFDASGQVTNGPAVRNLPTWRSFEGPDGHLMVVT